MAKQLNVNLGFTADTSQARAQLQALQKSLRDLTHSTTLNTPSFQLTEDLHEATTAAAQLSVQLKNATNVNTGNLDLTKFSESMRASGMSLEKYQNQLYQLGPAGEKAFADLARSITLAEVPLKRSSKLLDNLWTTMKNTARWQLTSSAMHGFMGAVSSAYGYVQDLNESLNNIRIVTGYSADKMAEFAVEANKAAKALSTTTTEYANASLIYYQQGLSDTAVKERTDITVKMANVSRQSAETVSEQLTAIWNNFDDGTQSLEYYVDVITALGAATASSSEEISDGLEKFAAVAETVGLSYEYATAALATVTATTRQSADVVGTAFKTLFARLNDLKLGETLDDGTTLGQYTENLARIGVNIKDASGQLKDMDIILNETAAKWGDLDKAQQVALAKGVAGIRQYTQFIALMDNWDFMQENLKTVEASGGTLQQQADIYADSWEAANKKVKASAQSVYEALLNDDFFIDLTNGFSELLDGVKSFIDGLGGVRGVLLAIGSIVTRVFSKQIGESLSNVAFTLKGVFNPKKAQADAEAKKMQANELLIQGAKDIGTTSSGYSAEAYAALGKNQLSYIQNAEKMNQEEQAINQILMDRNRQLADEVIAAGQIVEQVEERIQKERSSLQIQAQLKAQAKGIDSTKSSKYLKDLTGQQKAYEKLTKSSATFINLAERANLSKHLKPGTKEAVALAKELKNVVATTANISTSGSKIDSYDTAIKKLSKNLGIGKRDAKALWNELSNADNANIDTLTNQFTGLSVSTEKAAMSVRKSLITSLTNCGFSAGEAEQQMKEYDAAIDQWGPSSEQAAEALRKLNVTIDQHNGKMQEATLKPIPMGQALSTAASGVMALGQAFTTVTGIIDVFNNEEATTTEKIIALISGVGMLIPAIMSVTKAFSAIKVAATTAAAGISVAMWQITLIVAAVTALIGVIALVVTAESKAEKAAKKASKAAEDLADGAEEAKQELEDLKNAFDAYDSAVKALNACTKGTKEWDDALKNVNQTVLDIIKNNPQVLGQADLFTRNAEGMLELNKAKRDEILASAQSKVTTADAAVLFGNIGARKTANDKALEDIISDIGATQYLNYSYDTVKKANYSARETQDQVITNYNQTTLNFSKLLNENLQSLAGLKPEEFKEKLKQIIMDQSSSALQMNDTYQASVNAFVEHSMQYQNAISELANSTNTVSQALIDAARLLTDQELGNNYSGDEKDIAAITMSQNEEKYKNAYIELMKSSKSETDAHKAGVLLGYDGSSYGIAQNSGSDNEIYQFIGQELAKYNVGYSLATGNTVQGNDDNRELVFLDAEGKRVKQSAEYWANLLASAKALQELGHSANEARETLTALSKNVSQGEASAITGLITQGNLHNLTGEARTNIINSGLDVESQDAVVNYLKAATGKQSDEELLKLFNVDTIDQVFAKWQNAWNSSEIAFDDIKSGWVKPIQDWYDTNSQYLQQFTAAGQSEILQSLTDAFSKAGYEGVEALGNVYTSVGDQADDLQKIIADADWTDPNAIDKINNLIEEQGIKIDTTSEDWVVYTSAMAAAGKNMESVQYHFTSLRQNIADVQSVISDLEIGSIISDEDYRKLLAVNPAIAEFFGIAANGYKFLGNSGDLSTLLLGNTKQTLEDVKAEFSGLKNIGQILMSDKYFDKNGNKRDKSVMELVGLSGALALQDSQDQILKYAGLSKDQLEEARSYLVAQHNGTLGRETTTKEYEANLAVVQQYYDGLKKIRDQYESGQFEDTQAEELWASSLCNGIKELSDAYAKGSISAETYLKYQEQIVNADLEKISGVKEALAIGEDLTTEQEAYLDTLEEQWDSLAAIADRGSIEYLEALDTIEDAMHQIKINALFKEASEINIDVTADDEAFNKTIKDLLNIKREIYIEVVSDAENTFKTIDAQLDKLNDSAAAIGESYTLTRDQLESVAAAYPGILENAKVVGEGLIQLDKNAMISALDRAKIEAESSAIAAKEEIHSKMEVLKAKQAANDVIIAGVEKLLGVETLSAEESAIIQADIERGITAAKQAEDQLQTDNDREEKNEQIEASNETAQAEHHNAEQTNRVWNDAFAKIAANAIASANEAIKAANAIGAANALAAGTGPYKGYSLLAGSDYQGDVSAIEAPEGYATIPEPSQENESNKNEEPQYTDEYMALQTLLDTYDSTKDNAALEKFLELYKSDNEAIEKSLSVLLGQELDIDSNLAEIDARINAAKNGLSGDLNQNDKEAEKIETQELKKQSDQYADIDAQIESINAKLAEQKKITEHSEGEEKLASLKKEKELIEQLNGKYQEKLALANDILGATKSELQTLNSDLQFDSNNNVLNSVSVLNDLTQKINDAKIKFNNAASKAEQEVLAQEINALEQQYEILADAIEQYGTTLQLIRNIRAQLTDNNYELQGKLTVDEGGSKDGDAQQILEDMQKAYYDFIIKTFEAGEKFNEHQLKKIDYYLNKISDDFYSMGEAAGYMSQKSQNMVEQMKSYESLANELMAAKGQISTEDLIAGLEKAYEGIMSNLEAIQDLDKEMQHYYEDTLSAGAEELAVYTSHMEHLTSVLEHYQNIVTMMNGEADFESIGTILEGKASTLNNEMKVAESNYAMLKAEQTAMQAAYDAADAEGKKYLKSSLDAINAQVDEAHEAMLSKTKEWAEAQRAIMENSMKKAAHEMEMVFTNNMGFDALNSSMDRLSSYSNEYLTKTNQIYETQKLMNTAQQAIDKTTNQAAKVRLENYNKEIKQLQEKNKLSNLELDIAKAKYDVLLAEIALEEAQNAKATVRLQRDSEGNYGYVYTADKENIAKAEQDLADAQNALYNIGLEGANDYGSKLLDLQQQLADELIALEEARAAGQYKTDEEYYAAKERLISEYNNLFEAYSAQYTTALEVDTAIQQEAWVNAYDEMILKTEDWQIHVDEYTTLCEESYSHWREIVQAESDIVTDLLSNVSDAVKNVTDESNNLKDKIVKEVIPAIENEYTQVRTAVLAYESLRAGLQLTIQRYEELAAAIQETMRQQALLEGQTNTPEVPGIPEEFSPEEPDNKIGHSEMMDLVEDIMVHGSYENDPERTQKILDAGYTAADRAAAQQIINDIARNESAAWHTGRNWDKVLDEYTTKYGYNTGGYTGEWGPEGRLAVLHQKELILNASDTQNFLMATEILRSIADIIDINSLHSQMSQLTPVGMTTSGQQTLEQAVSIEAHFPNVTDRNEIEEAFNNLINTASQYANRKF